MKPSHVAAVAFKHGRLRLLLELRAHAPIQIERAVEAQEAQVVVQDHALPQRGFGLLSARRGARHFKHQRVATAAEARQQNSFAGPGSRRRQRKGEQRVRRAEIAELGEDFRRVIGRLDARRTRYVSPKAGDRLMHGGVLDVPGRKPCILERATKGRSQHLSDRRLTHESLLRRVGLGMLARGVDVNQIMRQARPTEEPDRRVVGDRRRRAAVSHRKMQGRARAGDAPLAGGHQRRAGRKQRIEQGGNRAAARSADVPRARLRRRRQRIDQQRRVQTLEERRRRRGEYHGVGIAAQAARGLEGEGEGVLVPAADGARAFAPAAQAPKI